MKTLHHEPLMSEDEILNLLTQEAAAPPKQEPASPFPTTSRVIIGGALLAAAGIATVYYLTTDAPVVENEPIQPTASEQHVAVQQPPQASVQEDKTNRAEQTRVQPLLMTMDASRNELTTLGVNADGQKIWFVEDGQRITISQRGISLRPTQESDLNRTPVAVTLYDEDGAYASWYDHQLGTPEMNDLVAVKIPLHSAETDLHQNVVAYLWFAPEMATHIDKEIDDYQEDRLDARDVHIEKVFPNPVSGNEATLLVNAKQPTSARVSIMDVSGRELSVVSNSIRLDNGQSTIVLPDLQSLPSAMVLIVIDLPEYGTRLVQRLLIQR